MIWTDDAIDQLRSLRAQGYAFWQIARIMGVSRNAVIGKAARLAVPEPRHRRPRVIWQRPEIERPLPAAERVAILTRRVASIQRGSFKKLGYFSQATKDEAYRDALSALAQAQQEAVGVGNEA